MTRMNRRDEDERRNDMDMRYPDWRTDMRSTPYRGGEMSYGREPEMTGPYYGYEDDAEMRRGRDSRGRYTSVRSEYEPEMGRRRRVDGTYMGGYDEPEMNESRYWPPYGVPPVYERTREETAPRMHKIGFSIGGEMERIPEVGHEYKADGTYRTGDEMARRTAEAQKGYGMSDEVMPMTRETAMEWMQSLENADKTRGPHWDMSKTNTVMAQNKLSGDPVEWFVALNLMYSDYCEVAKKMGVNNLDFYVCMAKAFLSDDDAQPGKLERYYQFIAK